MFNKTSLALLLSASFSFAQVATVGGTATTAGPAIPSAPMSAANAPLISTPDIALPGSGPAMGAPISSGARNDSRSSNGPSVYNPNGVPVPEPAAANLATIPSPSTTMTSATSTITAPAATTSATTTATTTEPFENGIQHFESGLPNPSNPTQSLAQIARAYRAQHRQAAKTFNNDSISQLNARGVRTGNLGPETSTVVASSQPATQPAQPANEGTLMAQNQPPALPQSDQYQPASSAPAAPASSTAWQQRHKASEQNPPASAQSTNATQQQASTAQSAPAASQSNTNKQTAALPQTSSPLPLLLLLGGLGVVGGVVYWLRR